ncbi:PaaI family thioesterase [Terrisporobacter sp.]
MNKTDILDTVRFERMLKQLNESDGFGKEAGIKIVEISEGYAKAEIEISERHLNPGKSVHGGCIYTLADTVGGIAAWSRGGYIATTSGSINFLNPAIGCKKLIGVARELKYGKTISVYDIEILDENNRIIARVTNEYYNMSGKINL